MLTFKVGVLARHIGVHRNTVTNWIKKGKLSATPAAAKRYTISKSAFIDFCKKEHISKSAMERVLSDTTLKTFFGLQKEAGMDTDHPADIKTGDIENGPALSSETVTEEKGRGKILGTDKEVGAVLVVGGGIAGIQAALDLAESDYYVYLIEKTAGIGGTMAQLERTFPTDDCASCIILPKLVECGRHLNIELITLAEVESVAGSAGHFEVTIKKSPRYVDMDKCIACGICAQKCPIYVKDDFNFGIGSKKAVYIKHDQSVPLKYAIDPDACIYFTMGKCGACRKFCPTGAVNFNQTEEKIFLTVGAVILAPGFRPFNPAAYDFYGYRFKDVVTSLEFERLASVNGPNSGTLLRPSDNTEPEKIAWLQCIGSRNHNNRGHSYCSNICCMSAVKQSMSALEHIKGPNLDCAIFFMDLRSHGKESERYFERAKKTGVRFIRAMPHTLEPGKDGTGVFMRYMDETGRIKKEGFDLAVLSIGFEAPEDAKQLSRLFNIALDPYDFAKTSCFEPVESSRKGVFVAGVFQSPAAIPRSVVQATAAAASASELLIARKGTLTRKKNYPREKETMDTAPSVGVFVCSCGVNIAAFVDVEQIVAYAAKLHHVTYVENNLFSCSADAQESIIEKINEFKLNRIVIAACTPRTHEHMFQQTLMETGLNGFMVEMANIRNQNSWVHQQDAASATRKAKDQVRMAVAKIAHAYPLKQERISVVQTALVVGGGIAGMISAQTISRMGIKTVLVEESDTLGGNALKLKTSFTDEAVRPMLDSLVSDILNDKNITVYKNAFLESASGSVGNFKGELNVAGKPTLIRFGAAVMATGAREAIPDEYLYGQTIRVMTQMEFDAKVLHHPDEVNKAKSVVFIQCVGSREPDRPYCSRICCVHSVKAAISLKTINPDIKVAILYREIRTYGEWEEYYKTARQMGIVFIRYTRKDKPVVTRKDDRMVVDVFDPVSGLPVTIFADYLALASGVVARDNDHVADIFKFSVNSDGFFNGAHPKLKPVDLSVAGLFLCGLCNYPKPLEESIEEARAAAHRAVIVLSQEEIESEAIKSFVTDNCDGCALCVDVCPFHAISMADNARVVTDPALCQGCGICGATCPKEGIMVHGFTIPQLAAQVRAAVDNEKSPETILEAKDDSAV